MKYHLVNFISLLLFSSQFLPAQVFQCVTQASATPSARKGGHTETLGDVILICQGGSQGAQHATDVVFDLVSATAFTSRILNTTTYVNESVMFTNEPSPIGLPSVHGTYLMADNQVAYTRMRFPSVTITEPGPTGTSVYRFTNLRVSVPSTPSPQTAIGVIVSFSNQSLPPNPNPSLTLAIAQHALDGPYLRTANGLSPLAAPVQLSRCLPNNLSLANAPATANYTEGRTLTLRIAEAFPTVLRRRGESTHVNANTFPAITQHTALGLPYQNESLLWRTDANWLLSPSNIPAGQANTGTRLFVKLTSIPTGMRIFGAANDQGAPNNPALKRIRAVNLHGSLGTAGPTAVTALANTTIEGGLVESQSYAGARWLLYEVLPSIDTTTFETVDLPIVVAHKGGSAVGTGTLKIQAGLGPLSTAALPDVTSTIPRFQDLSVAQSAVTITPCICTYPATVMAAKSWPTATTAQFTLSFTNNSASAMNNIEIQNIRGLPVSTGITAITSSPLVIGTLAPGQTVNATIQLSVPPASRNLSKTLAYTLSLNSGACNLITQWGF